MKRSFDFRLIVILIAAILYTLSASSQDDEQLNHSSQNNAKDSTLGYVHQNENIIIK